MKSKIFIALLLAPFHTAVAAIIAHDDASNYAAWTNGTNSGTGFGAWVLNNSDGGNFLGPASAQGTNNAPLDTGGQSFGLFATGFSTATRELSAPLELGQSLNFSIAFQFDNGQRGFNLRFAGDQLFNFNINDGGYTWDGTGFAPVTPWIGVRENGVLVHFEFTRVGGSMEYTISSDQDANLNTTGSFIAPSGINNFEFYVSGAGGGTGGDFYFNHLEVIPEPSSTLLLVSGFALLASRRSRES